MNNSSTTELQLLEMVRRNPTMTIAQMAANLGVGTRQAERLVASLKEDGRLIRMGARRNGRWEVR